MEVKAYAGRCGGRTKGQVFVYTYSGGVLPIIG